MEIIIECLLTLKTHEIQNIGFNGNNRVVLDTPVLINEPFEVKNTKIEITAQDKNIYKLVITSSNLLDSNELIPFVESVVQYFSYLINKKELNPHYGTNFIDVEWKSFVRKVKDNGILEHNESICVSDTLNLRDTVSISSLRPFNVSAPDWQKIKYTKLLKFYYDGLRAEHKKSKYFHWFLILEYLEGTDLYKRMFNSNKLFTEDEQKKIREVADYMSDQVKKSAVLNLLSRTKEFRNRKLFLLLNEIGIKSYKSDNKSTDLSEKTIKNITDERNKLFHKGINFSDITLWYYLFPIVTEIIGIISKKPSCID